MPPDLSPNHILTTSPPAAFAPPPQPALLRNGKPVVYTVLRHALVSLLADSLPSNHTALQLGAGASGAELSADGAYVTLADGTRSGPYDLVVGADGIRSRVRATIFGGDSTPIFSGIRIAFGVCGASTRAIPTEAHQWFGDGMYTLCYSAGKGAGRRDVLAVCMAAPTGTAAEENPNWDVGQARETPEK